MRHLIRYTRYSGTREAFRLILIGDCHLGNVHCDERTLKMLAQRIATEEHTFWIGLGDYCEWINMRDPRFNPEELPVWLFGAAELSDIAKAETARFLDIMGPCAGKCLALCSGNHEDAILQHSERDVYSTIVDGLAVQGQDHRLDHRGFLTWRFGQSSDAKKGGSTAFRFWLTHGSGGGRKPGATANRLEDLAAQVDGCDVVVAGHTHRSQTLEHSVWRPGAKPGLVHKDVVHLISIPALCGDMQYADRKDLPGLPIGWAEITIVPERREISVETHLKGG